jgi:hypothetical protein
MQNLVFFYLELVLTRRGSASRGGARPGRGAGARSRGADGGTGTDGGAWRSSSDDERRRGAWSTASSGMGRVREREGKLGEGEREGAWPFIERGEERESHRGRGRAVGHQWRH